MRNIYPKFKINTATYFILLSFLLTGFIKNIIIIFLIIIIHECGHIFFLKLFNYNIEKIEIYPFGGVTTTSKYINSSINKDIIIYLGGFLFQTILYFIFIILLQNNIISLNTFLLFKTYNKSILIFNLLPIIPLDGGEIFLLILEKFLPYLKSLKIMSIISFIFLIIFFLINIKCNLNNYVILSYLVWKTIDFFKKRKHYQNKFLLERYLHNIPYKRIEHNDIINIDILKKETLHFFKNNNKYIHEKELLRKRFSKLN